MDAFAELKQQRLPNWGRYRKAQWGRCGPAIAATNLYGMGRALRNGDGEEDERTIRVELAVAPPPDVDEGDAGVIDAALVGLAPARRATLSAVYVWGRHHSPATRDEAIRALMRVLPCDERVSA